MKLKLLEKLIAMASAFGLTLAASVIFLSSSNPVINGMVIVGIITALSIVAVVLIRKVYILPLRQLESSIEKFADGEIVHQLPSNRVDELGKAFIAFNSMVELVRDRESRNYESEKKQRAILETAPTGIITIDSDGGIEDINPAAEIMFQYARFEIVGEHVSSILPSSEDTTEKNGIIGGFSTANQQVVAKRKDGSRFPIQISVGPVDLNDRVIYTGIIQDISELVQSEEELKRHREDLVRQNEINEATNILVSRMRGKLTLKQRCERCLEFLVEYMKAEAGLIYILPDESFPAMNLEAKIGLSGSDSVLGMVQFGEGIIGRCAQEKKTFILKDLPDGHIIISNGMGQSFAREVIVAPIQFDGKVRGVIELASLGHFDKFHQQMLEKNLENIGISINSAQARIKAEELLSQSKAQSLELVRQKEELQNKAQALELANKYKTEFLANMSHEIRTPMNAILGMAEILSDTSLTDDQQKDLKIIQRAGNSLLELINDILDLSKIEAGQLKIESRSFDIQQTIEESVEVLALKAQQKSLELNLDIALDVPKHVLGDSTRLRQILINLIGNAIKFTSEGHILVKVKKDRESGDSNMLFFEVRDTGIGIPKEKHKDIFESFTQADSSTTREYGGTGLGLNICKELIEMMGGKIWIESHIGEGSRFYFTLCLEESKDTNEKQKNQVQSSSLQNRRALIVDDNETSRTIISGMLKHFGITTKQVASASEALHELEQATNEGKNFDWLLTDLKMHPMNGIQLVECLRNNSKISVQGVLMLSSDPSHLHTKEIEHLHLNAYLTKPIKRDELFKALQNSITETPLPSIELKPLSATNQQVSTQELLMSRPTKILVAEDTENNQLLLTGLLKKFPIEMKFVMNGQEAVEAFQAEEFDLILMDMQMPVMDGYSATQKIRELEKNTSARIPIVAVTAHAMGGDRDKCIASGCDDYLSKPIKKTELYETIATRRLEKKETKKNVS